MLLEEKKQTPSRIPWRLSFSEKHPGFVEISYIPNRRLRKEYITVRATSFKFRKKSFPMLNKLEAWFKANFSKHPSRFSANSKMKSKMDPGSRNGRGRGVGGVGGAPWKKGDKISARFRQDGKWYEAEVMGVEPGPQPGRQVIKVQYVGFEKDGTFRLDQQEVKSFDRSLATTARAKPSAPHANYTAGAGGGGNGGGYRDN
eukprot:703366-Amorphochlora_amoeboformis.AAC.1